MPRCSTCGLDRAEDKFYKRKDRLSGRYSSCKDCCREKYGRPRLEKNKEAGLCACGRALVGKSRCEPCRDSQRRSQAKKYIQLKKDGICHLCKKVPSAVGVYCQQCSHRNNARSYGISAEEYADRRSRACEICGAYEKPGRSGDGMCIDHNHRTDTLRGTLCGQCNRGLGCLGDDLKLLRAAALYLEKYL